MAGKDTLEFTETNFEQEVLQSDVPVLVDFWAEWCMPCLRLAPTIDGLATEYAGRAKVGKVDTEAAREIAMKYKIATIPTVIVFKDGQPRTTLVGLRKPEDFRAALDAAATVTG